MQQDSGLTFVVTSCAVGILVISALNMIFTKNPRYDYEDILKGEMGIRDIRKVNGDIVLRIDDREYDKKSVVTTVGQFVSRNEKRKITVKVAQDPYMKTIACWATFDQLEVVETNCW